MTRAMFIHQHGGSSCKLEVVYFFTGSISYFTFR